MRVEINMKFEKDWFRLRRYRQQGVEIENLYHTVYLVNVMYIKLGRIYDWLICYCVLCQCIEECNFKVLTKVRYPYSKMCHLKYNYVLLQFWLTN